MDIRGRLAGGGEGVFAVDRTGRLIVSGASLPAEAVLTGLIADSNHEMKGVVTGTGTLTPGRTNSTWVKDADGVYWEFGSGELAWEGGRVTGPLGARVVYDTDSGGIEYVDPPRLVLAPAAENLLLQSNTLLTTWQTGGSLGTPVQNIPGLFGANTGWTLTDNDAAAAAYRYQILNISADSGYYVFRFWVPKTTAATYHPRAVMYLQGGSPEIVEFFYMVNTDTGTHNAPSVGTMDIYDDGGDFWQVLCRLDDTGDNTTLNVRFCPASHTGNFVNNTALIGSSGFCQGEVYKNLPIDFVKYLPPIVTTTASYARIADTYTYNTANLNTASGAAYVDVMLVGDTNLLAAFLARSGGNAYLSDGQNNISGAVVETGVWRSIGSAWDDTATLMAVNVEGSWSPDQLFDGNILTGIFDLARGIPGVVRLRNLRTYEVPDV